MRPDDPSDFFVRYFTLDSAGKHVDKGKLGAYWNLRRTAMKPYIKLRVRIDEPGEYHFYLHPRTIQSYPAQAVFKRELLREAMLRGKESGSFDVDLMELINKKLVEEGIDQEGYEEQREREEKERAARGGKVED